ncbi:nucleoside hydrolase [soil metagenome]
MTVPHPFSHPSMIGNTVTLPEADRLRMLTPRTGRVRAVLDTDTYNEIDDQFAVVQALLSPERIQLEAIYAAPFFNERADSPGHGMQLSHDEICRLLDRLDRSPEGMVFKGVTEYVGPQKQARSAPAVDDLIARARSATPDEPLYVIAIAAISNIASALLAAPDIIDRVVVIWLGGHALEWPHQVEFNLKQDVGGAQVLFDSGVPLVLVPCMGVVSHFHSTIPEIDQHVRPHGRIGEFLATRFAELAAEKNLPALGWSKVIWDMVAVAWLLNADWTPSVLVPTPILTDQITFSVDRSRHLMRYVTHLQRDAILRDFVQKLTQATASGTAA